MSSDVPLALWQNRVSPHGVSSWYSFGHLCKQVRV